MLCGVDLIHRLHDWDQIVDERCGPTENDIPNPHAAETSTGALAAQVYD